MKKATSNKSITLATSTLLSSLLLLSNSANAFFKIDTNDLIKKARASAKTQRYTPPKTCINLDGKWAGTCEHDGVKTPGSMEIVQSSCSNIGFINSDNTFDSFGVNGIETKASGSPSGSGVVWKSSKFTPDGQILNYEIGAILNTESSPDILRANYNAVISLDGADIVAFMTTSGTIVPASEFNCRYSKVK